MNSILSATVLIPLIVIVLLIVLLCVGYVKAPPDMAYIISGVKKKSKVVIGKASIRIPFFERLEVNYNTIAHPGPFSILVVFVIPVGLIIGGFIVWFRRRRR